MVTATILGMALATFLQSWGGRVGSGMLLVHMPDPLLVVLSGMLAAEYGIGGLVLVGVVNGTVALGAGFIVPRLRAVRSEEHTSELQSLMRNSYAVFCLKKNNDHKSATLTTHHEKASRHTT